MDLTVPIEPNRSTLEDGGKYASCGVYSHKHQKSKDGPSKGFVRKDAQIEQQDWGLCQIDGELVQDLNCPEALLQG